MVPPEKSYLRRQLEYWLLGFSLTNCYLWPVWSSFLNPSFPYFEPGLARLHLGTLLLIALVVPSILLVLVNLSIKSEFLRELRSVGFAFAILSIPLLVGLLALLFSHIFPQWMVAFAVLACVIFFAVTINHLIVRIATPVLKILIAVAAFLFLSGLYLYFRLPSAIRTASTSPIAQTRSFDSHPLILVIIFDEMDGHLISNDPDGVRSLPSLAALRSQSIVMTSAQSAGNATLISIPALMTGTPVREANPTVGPDLDLTFADNHRGKLTQQSTLFDDVRKTGRRISIIGWYHPYCQLFKSSVDECFWAEWTSQAGNRPLIGRTFLSAVSDIAYSSLPYLNAQLALRQARMREFHHGVLDDVQRAAMGNLRSRSTSFVLIHLPVPHPPYLSNVEGQQRSYIGNLAISDQVLGEFRSVLVQSGRWDSTTVIVTSDHTWRKEMWNNARVVWGGRSDDMYTSSPTVPMIIKLPHQRESITYSKSLNNVILRKMIDYLLQHPDTTPADLTAWMDSNQPNYTFGPIGHY